MKHTYSISLLTLTLVATLSQAKAQTHTTYIDVPVSEVEPITRTVTHKVPHEKCWDERIKVVSQGYHSATAAILGAVIGGTVAGALGNNSGHQGVIAGAGALLGASIGHDSSHRNRQGSYYTTEQRCEVDYELREKKSVVGYRVSYRYGDTIYQTRMTTPPGDTIKLRVDVQPVE